eukprot:TRINITY_DN7988_c0_g1_i5.p2 TRINITY_DN7988_c0_g1~~TRINITY_DN7988_c0_g1_i5.p2  ORF type:complete len:103 (-),score=16.52 TRINITY_DN7988_c0_g1_i5:309-617(-)
MGNLCNRGSSDRGTEFVDNPTNKIALMKPDLTVDSSVSSHVDQPLEREFSHIVYNIPLQNEAIKSKRHQLGEFLFNTKQSTEGLTLVNGEQGENGELYYGFV